MLRRWLRLRQLSPLRIRYEVAEGDDLASVAVPVCHRLTRGDVVFLHGGIGAGKTTLVQACARALGVAEPVTSPTFALAHRYDGPVPVVHLDLYRLADQPTRDVGELIDAIDEHSIAFVEWPELGGSWLPPPAADVWIDVDDRGRRLFTVQHNAADSPRADG